MKITIQSTAQTAKGSEERMKAAVVPGKGESEVLRIKAKSEMVEGERKIAALETGNGGVAREVNHKDEGVIEAKVEASMIIPKITVMMIK